MEKLISEEDIRKISQKYQCNFKEFVDYFIKYEDIFDYLTELDENADFDEYILKIREKRPLNPLKYFNKFLFNISDDLKTKKTARNYLTREETLFRDLESKNSIDLNYYKRYVLKTICSIYNLSCDLKERLEPDFDYIDKILILEASPLDLDPLNTRYEAIDISDCARGRGALLPIVRIGTSRQVFKDSLVLENIVYIHFCGHSCHTNIALMGDDGNSTSLNNDKVIEYIKTYCVPNTSKINFVFYNSCESVDLAYKTFNEIKDVYSTLGNKKTIFDYAAYDFALSFYNYHFINNDPVLNSYNKTKSNFLFSTDLQKKNHANQTSLYV